MSRIRTGWGIAFLVVFAAVSTAGIALAGDETRSRMKLRWVEVDADGNQHEETIELDGPRPFLGVQLGGASGRGALVESVLEDTAAERAGLRAGDVIVGFGGEEIASPGELSRAVLRSKPGDRVEIDVMRDGRRRSLDAELGENDDLVGALSFDMEGLQDRMKELHGRLEGRFDSDAFGERMEGLGKRLGEMKWDVRMRRPLLGVGLVSVTPELREHLGARDDEGVLIGKVYADTAAAEAGIEVGDVIVAVDGESVDGQGTLRRLLHDRAGETFSIDLIRDGRPAAVTVTLPDLEESEDGALGSRFHRRTAPQRFQRDES